jgi:hypothetical protein
MEVAIEAGDQLGDSVAESAKKAMHLVEPTLTKTVDLASDLGKGTLKWTRNVGGNGKRWMKRNAPHAWNATRSATQRVVQNVDAHDEEVRAALKLLSRKSIQAGRLVLEHDQEIMAALAVLAIYQPYIGAVILAYEAGRPGLEVLKKVLSQLSEGEGHATITASDIDALKMTLQNYKAGRMNEAASAT